MARQWIFWIEKMFIFLKSFESSHPKQLSYWYLWEDQIEKRTQRSFTISLRDSLNKMKTEIRLGTKIKIHIQHKFPFTTLCYVPLLSPTPHLWLSRKSLDLWISGLQIPLFKIQPLLLNKFLSLSKFLLLPPPPKSFKYMATCFNFPFPIRFTESTLAWPTGPEYTGYLCKCWMSENKLDSTT